MPIMTVDPLSVRPATTADLDAMGLLFEAAFDEPYGAAAVGDLLKPPSAWALIAETDRPVGFLLASTAADEAEILSIGVAPNARGKGIGKSLINFLVQHAKSKGAIKIFLEVASDNTAGLALYDGAGFKRVGLRRNYYKRRGNRFVDALILRRDLA